MILLLKTLELPNIQWLMGLVLLKNAHLQVTKQINN
jgi:hypothetical protein